MLVASNERSDTLRCQECGEVELRELVQVKPQQYGDFVSHVFTIFGHKADFRIRMLVAS